jgi:hypothetical protein
MRLLGMIYERAFMFLRLAGGMLRIVNGIVSIRIRQRRGHTSVLLEPRSPGRLPSHGRIVLEGRYKPLPTVTGPTIFDDVKMIVAWSEGPKAAFLINVPSGFLMVVMMSSSAIAMYQIRIQAPQTRFGPSQDDTLDSTCALEYNDEVSRDLIWTVDRTWTKVLKIRGEKMEGWISTEMTNMQSSNRMRVGGGQRFGGRNGRSERK